MALGSFLQQVAGGILSPHGNLGDYQHASRLFVDNTFALAPKNSWIFYVSFDISQAAIQGSGGGAIGPGQGGGLLGLIKESIKSIDDWQGRHQQELGMLVKSADLPKFTIETETMNQYNRKTIVQKKVTYNPITIGFHDDMSNVTHRLWTYYYNYYYADGKNPSAGGAITPSMGAMVGKALGGGLGRIAGNVISPISNLIVGNTPAGYMDNKYKENPGYQPGAYGLNNAQTIPFFNSITLYQLNQQQFTSFTLINPIIKEWQHDKLDVSTGNKVAENKMIIEYETVLYGTGYVTTGNPPGFATIHYDQSPSPLSVLGSVGNAVKGANASDLFGSLTGLQGVGNPLGAGGIGLTAGALLMNKSVLSAGSIAIAGLGKLFDRGKAGVNAAGIAVPTAKDSTITAKETSVQPEVNTGAPLQEPPGSLGEYDLPDPLPEDSASLEDLKSQQETYIGNINDQISSMNDLKASFQDRINQAQEIGDDTGLENIYAEMESEGYVDPSLLQSNLDKVTNNILTLTSAINQAMDAENEPQLLGGEGDNTTDVAQDNSSSRQLTDGETDALFAEQNSDEQQDEWWA